jgi:hypothetical protein
LAVHVHRTRPDVQAVFPDLYGQDRIRYAQWFCRRAPVEYEIDEEFVHPVWETFVAWATAPADHGRAKSPPVMITRLAAAIHAGDPGLQERFPDLCAPPGGLHQLVARARPAGVRGRGRIAVADRAFLGRGRALKVSKLQ